MRSILVISVLAVYFIANSSVLAQTPDLDWWKHAVFYQIYPRSFKDENNDGIGDLQGIIKKLDHFTNLGVDAIWLSPIFTSPQVDQGYDVSNYTDVDPLYGTIDDLQELIDKAHNVGIRVVLDFVPNHSSEEHQWFKDSVNNVEEYKDYYVWVDPKFDDDGNRVPPNNWISVFKNSAWTWNEKRQQYYFHQFMPAQPDLNFRNLKVVAEMKEVLKFWMDRGVDGFRIDAVPHIFEDEELRDELLSGAPGYTNIDYEYLDHAYTKDQPKTYDVVYQFREFVDQYTKDNKVDQKVLMTEAYTSTENTMLYFGTSNGSKLGAHFTFNFNLISINADSTAQDVVNTINNWLNAIPEIYTSNWVIGNHDNHRAATRLGLGNVDGFNMLNLLLPGVGVTYNGEEIGLENGNVTFEQGQDPSARDRDIFESVSRDFERTPYHWDDSENAGFNMGHEPWLPVSEKYIDNNLKKQVETDGPSHYKIYQSLIKFRKNPIIESGNVHVEAIGDEVILVKRNNTESSVVLVFNKGDTKVVIKIDDHISTKNSVEIASIDSSRIVGSAVNPSNLSLEAHEALVIASSSSVVGKGFSYISRQSFLVTFVVIMFCIMF